MATQGGISKEWNPDPTAPENIESVHGRSIHVIRALMDEVRFEERGAGSCHSHAKEKPAI
jgi:hypothetical protein